MSMLELGVIVAIVGWVTYGFIGRRIDKARREGYEDADQELQDYYEALEENRAADDLLSDYDRVQRVQDEFND